MVGFDYWEMYFDGVLEAFIFLSVLDKSLGLPVSEIMVQTLFIDILIIKLPIVEYTTFLDKLSFDHFKLNVSKFIESNNFFIPKLRHT